MYWVATCVALHAFAMQCEDDERSDDEGDAMIHDPFLVEGLSSGSDSDHNILLPSHISQTQLQAGKDYQQKLKEVFFWAKARRAE